MFYCLKMRGLAKSLLVIYVSIIAPPALGQRVSNERGASRDPNEPFNIGQQIIVENKELTLQQQIFYFQFDNGNFTLSRSRVAYGFSDALGIEATLPYFLTLRDFDKKSHGFGDVRILGQWNYYRTKEHLATFITGLEAPTGSLRKSPATGRGSVTYIAECGFIHSSNAWYADYFIQGFKRRKKNDIDHGSEVRFRTSLGPKIHFGKQKKSKLFTLIQLRSIYENQTKIADVKDPNTGGFVSVLGPLFSYRRSNGLIEGSVELPISQHVNGTQDHLQWIGSLTLQVEF